MVQSSSSKRKHVQVPSAALGGASDVIPPTVKRGELGNDSASVSQGREHQSVPERERLNLSLAPRVRQTVSMLADFLGMSDSQLVVHALTMALPDLYKQVAVVLDAERTMKGGAK